MVKLRRGGRHHRRPVHRRARHAADHAHLPHRRHGVAGVQAAADQGQVRRRRSLQRPAHWSSWKTATTSFSTRTAPSRSMAEDGRELEALQPSSSARSSPSTTAARSRRASTFVQWDPYNVPILSEKAGTVKFRDIIEGVTMKQEVDEATAQEAPSSSSTRKTCTRRSSSSTTRAKPLASYPIPVRRAHRRQRRRQDRRRHVAGQDPAQDRQDQGHHRRSAARGRVVRGAPSEGRRRNRQDRRHRRFRPAASAASARILIKDPQTGVGGGASHPASASTSSSSRATSSRRASS